MAGSTTRKCIDTPSPAILPALEKVLAELEFAYKKHPVWPKDAVRQAAIVAEEAGELVQATLTMVETMETLRLSKVVRVGMEKAIRKEAAQTAAMALRLLINYDTTY
jgi:hypothetical protein